MEAVQMFAKDFSSRW